MTDIKPDQDRRGRLRYRSWHRGTREMDLLLGSFADAYLADFTEAELNEYEAILLLSDPDLYNWVTGNQPLPANLAGAVMNRLCQHQFVKKAD